MVQGRFRTTVSLETASVPWQDWQRQRKPGAVRADLVRARMAGLLSSPARQK